MRGRRAADRRLERALEALRLALDSTRAAWMTIGGIAVIARGVHRLTTDIDAAVRGDAVEIGALLQALATQEIVGRIPDVEAFGRTNLVLLLEHVPTRVPLDVSLAWTGFERDAISARSDARFGRVVVPMATAEDLVILKAVAGRPKDIEDVVGLLVLHRGIDLVRVRTCVAELAFLAEVPEIVEELERAIRRAGLQGF
ncbi:MAG: hypothetical protein IT379_08655 [Deltaproteobacteria bacterium]|nr:hypothetical protein [Deltaproteobacteria bacterium]